MRIAWFTHRYAPCVGGAEAFVRAMVRRFVARGDAVDVLTSNASDLRYFTDRSREHVDAPAESFVDGAWVRRFAVRHLPFQRYFGKALSYVPHWPTQCRVASYLPILPGLGRVRGPYDLAVAVAFPYTNFSYAALRTARAAGCPLVIVPFLHLATPGDPVHRSYTRPHQIRLLREADLVVSATSIEAEAVAAWGIPRERILVLGMGIDPDSVLGGNSERFRSRWRIPAGARIVGHLATLDPNKGTNDLVRALIRHNAGRPEPTYLILSGPSTPGFSEFLTEQPPEIHDWLRVTGRISDEERRDFFAAIDLFAMPSRTDSFGIVFLEAWANAKPVVAARAGGVPAVVDHGRTGLLVPFGDVEALAEAIGRLTDNPLSAESMGRAGLDQTASGHTWDERFRTFAARVSELRSGGAQTSISASTIPNSPRAFRSRSSSAEATRTAVGPNRSPR